MLLLTAAISNENFSRLIPFAQSYALLYDRNLKLTATESEFFKHLPAVGVSVANPQKLIKKIALSFFAKQSGLKLGIKSLELSPNFHGKISYQGNLSLTIAGDFGKNFRPLATWRNNVYVDPQRRLEVWLEFQKSADCQLQLVFYESSVGNLADSQSKWIVSESQMKQVAVISRTHNDQAATYLTAILYAKGQGKIQIGNLHFRWTRFNFGSLILGGESKKTAERQEVLTYFDPGDFKPPLNVYFAGYRQLEGFEGYPMMKALHAPFILFSDPRLEGGAFYFGNAQYQQVIIQTITAKLKDLGFSNQQLILSGLSMGSFGALYYGRLLKPAAIILGKPLINLGTIAENHRLLRPDDFATSLDILQLCQTVLKVHSPQAVDQQIWQRIMAGDFRQTKIAAAYMKNDDYDQAAFLQLKNRLQNQRPLLIGKGWIGRHNDNSSAIINWFLAQFRYFLAADFGRTMNE